MPRSARKPSESSIYHVFNRGAGKQIVFESEEDFAFFMKRLRMLLSELDGTLLAWCLMDNHYHLLVRIAHDSLSALMQRLQTTYAGYFNRVHEHVGAVFSGRFKSKAVDSDEYLMTVVRYIHQNPAKPGAAAGLSYRWSSYGEYMGTPHFAETDFVLGVFGTKAEFERFHSAYDQSDMMVDAGRGTRGISGGDARRMADELLGKDGALAVRTMDRASRDAALALLKAHGLSVRQIQRLTGVPLGTISRAREKVER